MKQRNQIREEIERLDWPTEFSDEASDAKLQLVWLERAVVFWRVFAFLLLCALCALAMKLFGMA